MSHINIHEAKTHLSRLLEQVAAGEEVIICRNGTPVAKLVSLQPRGEAFWGMDRGLVRIHDDFDTLPEGFEEAFGG